MPFHRTLLTSLYLSPVRFRQLVNRPSSAAAFAHTPSSFQMFSSSSYRQDQPKTFSNQGKLPRLPIPELDKSLEGYLKSLAPVLEQKVGFPVLLKILLCTAETSKYGASSLANEVEKRKLFARDFAAEGGLGRALQERLIGDARPKASIRLR